MLTLTICPAIIAGAPFKRIETMLRCSCSSVARRITRSNPVLWEEIHSCTVAACLSSSYPWPSPFRRGSSMDFSTLAPSGAEYYCDHGGNTVITTVNTKGQVTIPEPLRCKYGFPPGTKVVWSSV